MKAGIHGLIPEGDLGPSLGLLGLMNPRLRKRMLVVYGERLLS